MKDPRPRAGGARSHGRSKRFEVDSERSSAGRDYFFLVAPWTAAEISDWRSAKAFWAAAALSWAPM